MTTGQKARKIMIMAKTIQDRRQRRLLRGKLDKLSQGLSSNLRDSILREYDRQTSHLLGQLHSLSTIDAQETSNLGVFICVTWNMPQYNHSANYSACKIPQSKNSSNINSLAIFIFYIIILIRYSTRSIRETTYISGKHRISAARAKRIMVRE